MLINQNIDIEEYDTDKEVLRMLRIQTNAKWIAFIFTGKLGYLAKIVGYQRRPYIVTFLFFLLARRLITPCTSMLLFRGSTKLR